MMIISKFNQSINFSQKMKVEPRITESRRSLVLTRVLLVKFTDNLILKGTMLIVVSYSDYYQVHSPVRLVSCWHLTAAPLISGRWRYLWSFRSRSRWGCSWSCSPCPPPVDLRGRLRLVHRAGLRVISPILAMWGLASLTGQSCSTCLVRDPPRFIVPDLGLLVCSHSMLVLVSL